MATAIDPIATSLDLKPLGPSLRRANHLITDQIQQALNEATGILPEAMVYAMRGGKMLRGFLAFESARLHGIPEPQAIWAAAAIECLHTYSLIHDDLPCMDDDDLRRGRATVHRKWDEATAVLAGDALQSLAFELVAKTPCAGDRQIALVLSLAKAAGVQGMVGGQAMDILAETSTTSLTVNEISTLQRGKTGALIEWAATVGPRIAGADITSLHNYAKALGLAFQIADDIMDVEGDPAKAGKRLQKDQAAGKATFVSCLGLAGAKIRASELVEEACDTLSPYGKDADTLREAARFVISRDS